MPRSSARKAAAATSATTVRRRTRPTRKFNILIRKGPGGEMQLVRQPIPEMPEGLRRVIEEQK